MYAYRPPAGTKTTASSRTGGTKRKQSGDDRRATGSLKVEVNVQPFRYNPLHDLESLLWIGIYFLTAFVPAKCLQDVDRDLIAFVIHLKEFFETTFLTAAGRREVFTNPQSFRNELYDSIHPDFREAGEALVDILDQLAELYEKVERSTPPEEIDFFTIASQSKIYDVVTSAFKQVVAIFEEEDVVVERLDHPALSVAALNITFLDSEPPEEDEEETNGTGDEESDAE